VSEEKIQKALEIERKRVDGTFEPNDAYDYLKVLSWISNQSVYAEDELYSLEKTIQFKLTGIKKFWLKIENNKLDIGEGVTESPDVTIRMSEKGTVKFFSKSTAEFTNEISALFRSGAITFKGNVEDRTPLLILLRSLMAIAEEELKDMKTKLQED